MPETILMVSKHSSHHVVAAIDTATTRLTDLPTLYLVTRGAQPRLAGGTSRLRPPHLRGPVFTEGLTRPYERVQGQPTIDADTQCGTDGRRAPASVSPWIKV